MIKFALAILSPLLVFIGLGDRPGSAEADAAKVEPFAGLERSRFSGENEVIREYCVRSKYNRKITASTGSALSDRI